jgi:hypothetical protein
MVYLRITDFMRILLFFFLFPAPCILSAQESSSGDSSVAAAILKSLSAQYGTQDTTLHYLTKKQLLRQPVSGTEISADMKKGTIMRILLMAMSADGNFSEEYIFIEGKIAMVYQTFEFFREVKSDTRFTNFKGAKGWESRFFFVNEKMVFRKTNGIRQREWIYNET